MWLLFKASTPQADGLLPQTACGLFRHLFLVFSLLLVFCLLTLDLLFRLSSFMLSMTWVDIVVNTGGMVILLSILAVVLAVVCTAASLLIRLPVGIRAYPRIAQVANYLALFLLAWGIASAFKWWVASFHYVVMIKAVFIALAAWLVMLFVWRRRLHDKVADLLVAIKRPLLVLMLVSMCLIGWRVGSTVIQRHEEANNAKPVNPALAKGKPNIILITFDALSAGDMSLYGYHLNTTPNIDAFAENSYVFDQFYANSNWTRPSLISIFTGLYPFQHKLYNTSLFNYNPAALHNNFINHLKLHGYRTHAVAANVAYAHPSLTGMNRYFDTTNEIDLDNLPLPDITLAMFVGAFRFLTVHNVITGIWAGSIVSEKVDVLEKILTVKKAKRTEVPYPPGKITDQAVSIVSAESKGPYFLWIHYNQPHYPYFSNPKYRGAFLKGDTLLDYDSTDKYCSENFTNAEQKTIDNLRLRYNETSLYVDSAFGQFIEAIKRDGKYGNTIIAVSADHGESFGNNYIGHNKDCLDQSVIKIPFLIHVNSQVNSQRIEDMGEQIDIFPTLLQLASIPQPEWSGGKPLLGTAKKQGVRNEKIVYSMNLEGNSINHPVKKGRVAVLRGNYKLVYDVYRGDGKLFDLSVNKKESIDVSLSKPEVKKFLVSAVRSKLQSP